MPSSTPMPFDAVLAGAVMAVAQVSTLGQPFEVLKTHLAANRHDSMRLAIRKTWNRGGVAGFYQGLMPWGWVEASSKGAILLVTSSKAEGLMLRALPNQAAFAGTFGGLVGGLAQAYLIMGLTTTMKTVEITRSKAAISGMQPPSTIAVCRDIYRREGYAGLNKGVNAVALRQMTTWGSRMGITRFIESTIRSVTGKRAGERLTGVEKVLASCGGGALSCWNQPLEVLRIEMQRAKPSNLTSTAKRPTMLETAKLIYRTDGPLAFFRGFTPRLMLAASVTTFMVAGGDWFTMSLRSGAVEEETTVVP